MTSLLYRTYVEEPCQIPLPSVVYEWFPAPLPSPSPSKQNAQRMRSLRYRMSTNSTQFTLLLNWWNWTPLRWMFHVLCSRVVWPREYDEAYRPGQKPNLVSGWAHQISRMSDRWPSIQWTMICSQTWSRDQRRHRRRRYRVWRHCRRLRAMFGSRKVGVYSGGEIGILFDGSPSLGWRRITRRNKKNLRKTRLNRQDPLKVGNVSVNGVYIIIIVYY